MTSEFVIVTWQLRVTLVDSIHSSCDVLKEFSAEDSLQVPGDNQRRCGKERSCTCTSLIKYSDSNSSWILKVEIKWGSTVNTVELFVSAQQVRCPVFYNFYLTFPISLKIECVRNMKLAIKRAPAPTIQLPLHLRSNILNFLSNINHSD